MRFLVWVCLFLAGSFVPILSFAQPQQAQNCEEHLRVLQEDYAILQDQHAMITIPRLEADQRTLIKLRRDLERAQHRIKMLENDKVVKEKEPEP